MNRLITDLIAKPVSGRLKSRRSREKKPVGWREWCQFPALGVPAIKAKIDTGAKTSALHATHIRRFEQDGKPWVSFRIHTDHKSARPAFSCSLPLVEERKVRSSNGQSEKRIVVVTEVILGREAVPVRTHLTLTNREKMGFRLLIGRNTLKGRYLVDSSASFLLGRPDPVL